MKYENPRIPEGINVSAEHPLKEFFQLLFGIIATVAIVVFALAMLAEHVAVRVPFQAELDLAAAYRDKAPPRGPVTEYLQSVGDRIAAASDLPPGMRITVHYVDSDTVNAFATVGGNVVFFRGLVEKMPNENALAMVMAHEIAHIKHRHPIVALGRGVVVGMSLTIVTSISGTDVVGNVLGEAGLLTVLTFNRQQEEQADHSAIAALAKHYGHATGADSFFTMVQKLPDRKGKESIPTFLSSHPATQDRIDKLRAIAAKNKWAMNRRSVPLPESIRAEINKAKVPPLAKP